MHPADVYAMIKKRDPRATFTSIAQAAGLHFSTVASAPKRPQTQGNRAIAAFLGVPVHQIWPEWFDENGERRPSSKNSAEERARHRQTGGSR